MGKTSISWTEFSINPIRALNVGNGRKGHYCEKVSKGCQHCYSSRLQPRFGLPEFSEQRATKHIQPFLDTGKLQSVLQRKAPTLYFWCSMTDMFGAWVPNEWIDACFATMALTPQHRHQVLTKRPERMQAYCSQQYLPGRLNDARIIQHLGLETIPTWPLPNVWLGTSVENKATLNRLNYLCEMPAAVRFASFEPLLEDLEDITPWLEPVLNAAGLDWCIIGGESGSQARVFDLQWGQNLVDQCLIAGVPVWMKQVGANAILCGHPFPTTSRAGTDAAEWPEVLRVQEMPHV